MGEDSIQQFTIHNKWLHRENFARQHRTVTVMPSTVLIIKSSPQYASTENSVDWWFLLIKLRIFILWSSPKFLKRHFNGKDTLWSAQISFILEHYLLFAWGDLYLSKTKYDNIIHKVVNSITGQHQIYCWH